MKINQTLVWQNTTTWLFQIKEAYYWNGDLKNLQDFVTSLDLPIAKWSSPGGDCKLYESEGIAIRWYSKKGTITLNGERSDEIFQS